MAHSNLESKRVLTASDLAMLLSDSMVQSCTRWKDVGHELHLKKSVLDKIGNDRDDNTEDCIQEMIRTWLKTSENPTKDELDEATKRVSNRQARKRQRTDAENDAKRARIAIHEIEGLADKWKFRDNNLHANLRTLAAELRKEEEWLPTAEEWDRENAVWKNGENATKRTNIQKVIEQGQNFKNNTFVGGFLRGIGFTDPSKLKDQTVEGMLRQALAEIDVNRSAVLTPRYKKIKQHQQRLRDLQNEIKELKVLLDSRLEEYNEHKIHLDNIGARNDEHKRNRQIQELKDIIEECEGVNENCFRICMDEENLVESLRKDLEDHSLSLGSNIREMTKKESEFTKMTSVTERSIWSAFKGAVAGGALVTAGIVALPAVGIAVGTIASTAATVGATAGTGAALGAAAGYVSTSRPNSQFEKEIDKYRATLESARNEHSKLKHVMANYE